MDRNGSSLWGRELQELELLFVWGTSPSLEMNKLRVLFLMISRWIKVTESSIHTTGTSTTVSAQPGIRYQIFEDDSTAVTHYGKGQCEVTEETDYYRTFEENVNGMETFSSKHSGTQIGYETDISFTAGFESGSETKVSNNKVSGSTTSAMTIPPAYTGSDTTETSMSGKLIS